MRYYRSYMDRQEIPPAVHEKLLNLRAERRAPRRTWARYGALAACAVLIAGIGIWRLIPTGPVLDSLPPHSQQIASDAPEPLNTPEYSQDVSPIQPQERGFVVDSPAEDGKVPFPYVPELNYQDATGRVEMSASRAYAPGSFLIDLEKEDIQAIFWGAEGRPTVEYPKLEQGDLPWTLFWDGYHVYGYAWYDGQGQLTELSLYGDQGQAGFILELRLGALPFSCTADLSRGDEVSEFNGVEVTAWSQVYDRDGDGKTDYICGSEFITESGIGVRFENQNSLMQAEYGSSGDMELGGSCTFNALFVRQALTGGLYLDHLMAVDDVPAWREESFDTLEQAQQEAAFAPYLPTAEPEGYSAYAGNKDFHGHLSYQEGRENMLFVRWGQGYDNVEVDVRIPEGENTNFFEPVDIDVPESYDARLYSIPWCDSVPEEYQAEFYRPTLRAEDMSLAVVEAREIPHDTGGMSFRFSVLHENGVVVSYSCDGMTAQQVWELVEETLS